jgi:hypothetical protein
MPAQTRLEDSLCSLPYERRQGNNFSVQSGDICLIPGVCSGDPSATSLVASPRARLQVAYASGTLNLSELQAASVNSPSLNTPYTPNLIPKHKLFNMASLFKSAARTTARRTVGASNLRTIGTADRTFIRTKATLPDLKCKTSVPKLDF